MTQPKFATFKDPEHPLHGHELEVTEENDQTGTVQLRTGHMSFITVLKPDVEITDKPTSRKKKSATESPKP
jgi:hypothetical protein